MCSDITSLPQIPFHAVRHRKFSFPASLHSNILASKNNNLGDNRINNNNNNLSLINNYHLTNKRRFSNVSDVVTRKLSTTIGWRHPTIPTREIVLTGKALCGQYIRCRLKRSRCLTKKCGLQRLRSLVKMPEGISVREIFPKLLNIGLELERMYPKLYVDITKQVNGAPSGGIIITEKSIQHILVSVCRTIFRHNITWAKIVSMFAIAGGLATDCVRQNHTEHISCIIQTIGEIIEDELSIWINDNGGWIALQSYCKPKASTPITKVYVWMTSVICGIIFVILLLKWFGKMAFIK